MKSILYQWIATVHSWWTCHGTHELVDQNPFILDPKGPDLKIFLGIPTRGRWEKYKVCIRCGWRDDGKGYDE